MVPRETLGNVLITGGTGFFGKAMVKRLLSDNLATRICILSRDEYKQSLMRREFDDDRLRFFIGDVRDKERLKRAFQGIDVVIHAAALKRIEVGFYNPDEMIKTNVIGSMNVIEAAHSCKVGKVVALSTDKACEPISAYGQSKALAETLFLASNSSHIGPKFSVTRYGNVSNSTGSVIPTWRKMIADGLSVPITDPECTRFWMFEDEAVDLVLDTVKNMPKEIAIPTLPAYRLGDLATAMGAEVEVIGLPEWEKRHESMISGETSEHARRMTVEELTEALEHV